MTPGDTVQLRDRTCSHFSSSEGRKQERLARKDLQYGAIPNSLCYDAKSLCLGAEPKAQIGQGVCLNAASWWVRLLGFESRDDWLQVGH